MIFRDISESVPLETLVWCIPKHHRLPNEKPKLTTVFHSHLIGGRRMAGGHAASEYLYGDTIEVPTVEVLDDALAWESAPQEQSEARVKRL